MAEAAVSLFAWADQREAWLRDIPRGPLARRSRRTAEQGQMAHFKGLAAEDIVTKHYEGLGLTLRERRWRGEAGEIDLILTDGDGLVCVEVKSATSRDAAAFSLGLMQTRRIRLAAEEYLGTMPKASLTPLRLDLALVDGRGRVEILENALGFV